MFADLGSSRERLEAFERSELSECPEKVKEKELRKENGLEEITYFLRLEMGSCFSPPA